MKCFHIKIEYFHLPYFLLKLTINRHILEVHIGGGIPFQLAQFLIHYYYFCQGTQIWSSPQQENPLISIITFPPCKRAATLDSQGTIKLWHGDTGTQLATFSMSSTECSMVGYTIDNKPFLTVSTALTELPNRCPVVKCLRNTKP